MANQKYNRLTLSPHDVEDRKKLYDFRLNEMSFQYKLIMGLANIAWIIKTLNFIVLDHSSTASKQEFFFASFALASMLVTYGASLRWRRFFPYFIVMQLLGISLVALVQMVIKKEPEGEEWTFIKHMKLMNEMMFFSANFIVYTLFFSPSHCFTACTYLPITIVCMFIFMNLRYDMTDS